MSPRVPQSAPPDTDRAWLADIHGIGDAWPVVTEPFRQWVVEDDFAGDARFETAFVSALESLRTNGVQSINDLVGGQPRQ